jgi:hypothetical protein
MLPPVYFLYDKAPILNMLHLKIAYACCQAAGGFCRMGIACSYL